MAFPVSPDIVINEVNLTTIVPGVSTTTAGIAGVFNWGPINEATLITDENKLVDQFGKPTSNNAETFFSAANYLAYNNSLQVVRVANTTTTTSNSALNAFANTGAVANIASSTIQNKVAFDNKINSTFDANVLYIAKWAGDMGNSLRVSVCDNANAYSSNINLYQVETSNNITGTMYMDPGYDELVIVLDGDVSGAVETFTNNVFNSISVGDLLEVGNDSIGIQVLKVANVTLVDYQSISIYTTSIYTGAQSISIEGSSTLKLKRSWEYSQIVDHAPATSSYVSNFGNSSAVDLMHVVVIDEKGKFSGSAGQVLEVFQDVSRATDAKSDDGASLYYRDVINDTSKYVWVGRDRSGAVVNSAVSVISSTNILPLTLQFTGGQNGYSESVVPVSVLATGLDLFKSKETADISIIIQGKPSGSINYSGDGLTLQYAQLANYIIDNIASVRKDLIVCVTPDDNMVKSNPGQEAKYLAAWAGVVRDSTYAVIDSGYKYMYDRYNDIYRYVPLCGDIAGLIARTENTNDSWWSPAGFNRGQIKNIVKLRYNPSKAERDVLYKAAVNPVVTFPGDGTYLFGDKTATRKPSAFDRINVRRLFITLEKSISEMAKYSLFEFNDEFTRSQFRNTINPYLRDIQGRRGITDFLVVCDTSNNTPERIDRNEFWGDIYIKPARSINYIQLNFVAVRTGVEFSTVVGQF